MATAPAVIQDILISGTTFHDQDRPDIHHLDEHLPMTRPYFYPWIGWRYEYPRERNRYGLRLLVIGESHYYPPDEYTPDPVWDRISTREVISQYIGSHPLPFFTKVANVLLERVDGGSCCPETREVWNDVSFCNYIQRLLQKGERPNSQDWDDAVGPCKEVIRQLQPDAVLIVGYEVKMSIDSHNALCGIPYRAIMHPSPWNLHGYTCADAIAEFRELLEEAR